MRPIRAFLLRLNGMFHKERMDREFVEEIESHLQMQIEDKIRLGLTPAEARRVAVLESGGLESVKEAYRDRRGLPVIENLVQDLRYALRTLRRSPAFTLTALITLAIGIGANTAIFSAIEAVLLRPLPYRDPGRLAMLWTNDPKHGIHEEGVSYPNFTDWRRMNRSFEDMAICSRGVSATLTGGQEAEHVELGVVSSNLFSVLGVQPLIGRGFSLDEIQKGERVIVISHSLWMRRFGGSPSAIGDALEVDGVQWRVIGVMPALFQFPNAEIQFWEQLTSFRAWRGLQHERYSDWGRVIGRLKEHVTVAEAQVDMNSVGRHLELAYPPAGPEAADFAGFGVNLIPLNIQITGKELPLTLWLLMGAVLFVLLIGCVNVASLLLARGAGRAREIAVRQALGAARRRIVQQLVTESLLLAGAAGALGLGLAAVGIPVLINWGPRNLPRLDEVGIDPAVLAFALGVSLLAGILFGLAPAMRLSLAASVFGQRNSSGFPAGTNIRSLLVVFEVALSVVLLCSSGLLIRSFLRAQAVDPGFRPEHVLTMRISSPGSDQSSVNFYAETLERVNSLPGVMASGMIEDVFQRRNPDFQMTIAGRPVQPTEPMSGDAVSPGYFDAIGVRLLRGRPFSSWDSNGAVKVAIINETMARHLWPDEDPIGKRFRAADSQPNDPWYSIVGVVSDMRRQGLEREPIAQIFWPHSQRPAGTMDLVVRTALDPLRLASAIREQIHSIDKKAAAFQISTLDQRLEESLAPRRFESLLLGLLSAIALGLASIGIYGLMYYSVAQRTHEIGIRMALGARASEVVGMIIRQGMVRAAAGLVIGVAGALVATRGFSSLLFGVTPADPATFVIVTALIGAVAAVACCVPAWRAARIDPLVALRWE